MCSSGSSIQLIISQLYWQPKSLCIYVWTGVRLSCFPMKHTEEKEDGVEVEEGEMGEEEAPAPW